MRLYHYTCSHALPRIKADGFLKPWAHPYFRDDVPAIVWLSDMDTPDREALGLTSTMLKCDRTEHRIEVDVKAEPWHVFARRHRIDREVRDTLEEFGLPMHWYVSTEPIPVFTAVMSVQRPPTVTERTEGTS